VSETLPKQSHTPVNHKTVNPITRHAPTNPFGGFQNKGP
jgi:hypothetical protein